MKNKKNHFIRNLSVGFFGVIAFMALSLTIVLPSTVFAAGGQENAATIGGLCYKPGGAGSQYPLYITQPSDRETCEVGLQGEVIDPGESIPAPVCINNNRTRGYDTDYNPEKCVEDGGIPYNEGQELPKYYADDDSSFKNSQGNLQTPEALTNDDREELKDCSAKDGDNINEAKLQDCFEKNPIILYVNLAINVLSAGVGIVVVIMIIIGGIQYASAGGDPSKVKQAKTRITNAIIALIAYFFLFAFLQWLVPGGFF